MLEYAEFKNMLKSENLLKYKHMAQNVKIC